MNPYFLGGIGAIHVGAVKYNFANLAGSTNSGTQFSSTWGAGIRVNAAKHFAIKTGVSWTPTYITTTSNRLSCPRISLQRY